MNNDTRVGYRLNEVGERPWGYWRVDEVNSNSITKTIVVNPGETLSLQMHRHRSELWEVIEGVAEATINDRVVIMHVGDMLEIPAGALHRLRNSATESLKIREIQTGEILDESDIVRFDDKYGRV
jgi:mannose-1-phosphate guanylyltransferase/mannose-6-phosphate isomerase